MRHINAIVIHCSASPNGRNITVSDINRWHRDRGWRKIGYHFVVTVDGEVHRGRAIEEIGAHVEGSNANSIGICMVGTDAFSPAQWDGLRGLVRNLARDYPAARICGHRDFSPDKNGDGIIQPWEWLKTCPGFDVATWLSSGMEPSAQNVLEEA